MDQPHLDSEQTTHNVTKRRFHTLFIVSTIFSVITIIIVIIGIKQQTSVRQFASETPGDVSYPGKAKIFGITTTAYDSEYYDQALTYVRERNIHNNRVMLPWTSLQPNPTDKNYFDWRTVDNYMKKQTDITVLGVLGLQNMLFNQSCPTPTDPTTVCNLFTESLDTMLTSSRPALTGGGLWSDWEYFVYMTVSRYGVMNNNLGEGFGQGKVKMWEVLNEMDSDQTLREDPYLRGKKYGQILNQTARIIKLADPNASVISGGINDYGGEQLFREKNHTTISDKTKEFIHGVYDGDGLSPGVIEGFGVHPYLAATFDGSSSLVSYLESINTTISTYANRPIPLWVTEFGFTSTSTGNTCAGAYPTPAPPGILCQADANIEKTVMAENLFQLLGNTLVSAIYWYNTVPLDIGNPKDLHYDPAAYSLVSKVNLQSEWVQTGRSVTFFKFKNNIYDQGYYFLKQESSQDVSYFIFTNGQKYLQVFWSKTNSLIQFPDSLSGSVTLQAINGNKIMLAPYENNQSITVSRDPVLMFSSNEIALSSLTVRPAYGNQNPEGFISASCEVITGWSCDPSNFQRALQIGLFADSEYYQGKKPLQYVTANQVIGDTAYQQSISLQCGGSPAHNFSVSTPSELKDGQKHSIYAYGINIGDGIHGENTGGENFDNTLLTNSGLSAATFTCAGSTSTGHKGQPLPSQPVYK